MAGLFDIHTHTNMPGDGRTGEQVNDDDNDEVRLLRSARNATAAVASGVTTMCDCGSWNSNGFALKEGLAQGIVEGPRVLVSGPPLTVTGGHLWYMGGEADGVDAVRGRVREMVKHGADFIKVFPEPAGGVGFIRAIRGPLPHLPLFPTAGPTPENFIEYLDAGCVGVGFVRSLFDPQDLARGDLAAVRARAAEITRRLTDWKSTHAE
ncbi:MAG: amidohydrolase family protein [Planctomycetes bacterium]|nr:amidohydrolase family protein [Planctomycetota bacterium]